MSKEQPKINDGGPAFPQVGTNGAAFDRNNDQYYSDVYSAGGMTLRQWYAGMALQGIASRINVETLSSGVTSFFYNEYADVAFELADALIRRESINAQD